MGRRAKRQERRQNRREQRRGGRRSDEHEWEHYKMTQRLVAIGDDYLVENEGDEQVFVIDGKALRVRDTLKMTDLETGDEYKIQEKVVRIMDTMTIQKNGERAAAVKEGRHQPDPGSIHHLHPWDTEHHCQGEHPRPQVPYDA